jgi:GAF domain-containing protein/anti-sigma regulatory factor (Ser/Thr protein kinase)
LGKILQTLRDEDSVDALIKNTILYLREQFDYQFIWLGLYDPVSKKIHGKGGITPDGENACLQRSILINSGNLVFQVVNELCPVGVANLRGESRAPEWQEIAAKYSIQGTIILPIRHKDNCLGIVLLGSQRWGYLLTGDTRAKLLIVIGELGIMLDQCQKQKTLQQSYSNSATESLLQLLEDIRAFTNLDKKLEAAVQATDQFIQPARTSIYWFEREGNYFWCRMSSQMVNIGRDWKDRRVSAGITAQDLSDVYFALAVNQIVCLSEFGSSIKSHVQEKLLNRLGVRSLLAAPIIWQKDLLGFLTIESNEPRDWTPIEKSFVQGAAGFLSLAVPGDSIEPTVRDIQQNHELTNKFAYSVHQEQDLDKTLYNCANELLERLGAKRFILLEYDHSQDIYQVIYQNTLNNRRLWRFTASPLSEMDSYLLQNSKETIEITSLENDLRLFSWHSQLLENGVRSLLICNCLQGHNPDVLLIITHDSHRSWTTLQKELCWVVSQCLGVIVRNKQINHISHEQTKIAQVFKQYPSLLINSQPNTTESEALKLISDVLECPLAILLTWNIGGNQARIIPRVMDNHHFGIVADATISIDTDVLIELALAHNSYLILAAHDIPTETKKWLLIPENARVLVMALRTTDDSQPTGVVLLADYAGQNWTELKLSVIASLISQLGWWHSQYKLTQKLTDKAEILQKLNWYKHRRLQEIHRMSSSALSQIRDLGIPSNELTQMRYKLLLRQLNYINNSMTGVIAEEQWQLHLSWETMTIASLLKRSIERVDSLAKQQQLWIGVHGLTQTTENPESSANTSLTGELVTAAGSSPLATAGDIVKIELVIYELLVNACQRSPVGDRVDIWCRPLDHRLLEISITDNGTIDPELLTLLNEHTSKDLLTSTHLNKPPGLHLLICQNLIKQLGGELQIYQLSDNRIASRLVLPLAYYNADTKTMGNTFGSTSPLNPQ